MHELAINHVPMQISTCRYLHGHVADLGIDESTGYNITGRLAGTNDDCANPDEVGEGWDQDFHVIEGSAMTEERDGL